MTGSMTMVNRVHMIEEHLDALFPDPVCELHYQKDYELLIAVVLSAQTTDKRVNVVTSVLFERYPSLEILKDVPLEELELIIRSIGNFHKKAVYIHEIATKLVEEYQGVVPNDREALESLPGVGRKTTNVVLSNLYAYPAIAVDTHVERVSKRLGLAKEAANVFEVEQQLMKRYHKRNWSKRHHQMVLFGRYHCKAIHPECTDCPLQVICKYYQRKEK